MDRRKKNCLLFSYPARAIYFQICFFSAHSGDMETNEMMWRNEHSKCRRNVPVEYILNRIIFAEFLRQHIGNLAGAGKKGREERSSWDFLWRNTRCKAAIYFTVLWASALTVTTDAGGFAITEIACATRCGLGDSSIIKWRDTIEKSSPCALENRAVNFPAGFMSPGLTDYLRRV